MPLSFGEGLGVRCCVSPAGITRTDRIFMVRRPAARLRQRIYAVINSRIGSI